MGKQMLLPEFQLAELGLENALYQAMLDAFEDHLALLDEAGRIVFVNRTWRLFACANGVPAEYQWQSCIYLEVCQQAALSGDADAAAVAQGLSAVITAQQARFSYEYPCHSENEQRWFIMRVTPLDYAGKAYFLVSHHNITQRKLIEQAVAHSAAHDPLTGLANRRAFESFLNKSWRRAQRLQVPLSVLLLDLDHFKKLNDSLGHLEGDHALVRIATVLQSQARRETDLVARFGGDEFVLVLRDTDSLGAQQVAQRIIEKVRALDICSAEGVQVGASIGVVSCVPAVDQPLDSAALLRQADQALYGAKRTGGGALQQA